MKSFIYAIIMLWGLCGVANAQIKGPDKVDEHFPIVFEAVDDAQVYIWNYEKLRGIRIGDGKVVHLWGAPGKYTIKLTTIAIDWEARTVSYNEHIAYLTIGKPGPDPGPDPPTPTAFKGKVKAALSKVDPSFLSYRVKLGENYKAIADEAAANPNAWDVATMLNEVKQRHTSLTLPVDALRGWQGFWPELSQAMVDERLDSTDLQGHIKMFLDIYDVLKTGFT